MNCRMQGLVDRWVNRIYVYVYVEHPRGKIEKSWGDVIMVRWMLACWEEGGCGIGGGEWGGRGGLYYCSLCWGFSGAGLDGRWGAGWMAGSKCVGIGAIVEYRENERAVIWVKGLFAGFSSERVWIVSSLGQYVHAISRNGEWT